MASLLQEQGRHAEAEPLFREALAARREVRGARHPETLISLSNLVDLLREVGKLEEAHTVLGDTVAVAAEVFGPEHERTLVLGARVARLAHASAASSTEAAEATEQLRAVVGRMGAALSEDHPQTRKYAEALHELGV